MRACHHTAAVESPSPVNAGVSPFRRDVFVGGTPSRSPLTTTPPVSLADRLGVWRQKREEYPPRAAVSPSPQLMPPPPMSARKAGRPNLFDDDANQESVPSSQNPNVTVSGNPSPLVEARFGVLASHRPASAPLDTRGAPMGSRHSPPCRTTSPVIFVAPSAKKLKFYPSCGVIVDERDPNSGDSIAQYQCGALLGTGGYGKVYEFYEIHSGKVYACKIIDKSKLDHSGQARVHQEIDIQRRMQHPSILQIVKSFWDRDYFFILFERCLNKNLMEISKARGPFSTAEVRYIMGQICCGVEYLHKHNIIHRDIKLGNIMVDFSGNMKLGDFGFACELNYPNERKTRTCGTPNFIAPEVLACNSSKKVGYGLEADIWSLGVVLFVLSFGYAPFATSSLQTTYDRIHQVDYSFPDHRCDVPESCKRLIVAILQRDPSCRPSLRAILDSEFLRGWEAAGPPLVHQHRAAQHSLTVDSTSPHPLAPAAVDIDNRRPTAGDAACKTGSHQRHHRAQLFPPPPDAFVCTTISCAKYGHAFRTLQVSDTPVVVLFNDRTKMISNMGSAPHNDIQYYARELCRAGPAHENAGARGAPYCDILHVFREKSPCGLVPDAPETGDAHVAAATKKMAIVNFLYPFLQGVKTPVNGMKLTHTSFQNIARGDLLGGIFSSSTLTRKKQCVYVKECVQMTRLVPGNMTLSSMRMSDQSFQVSVQCNGPCESEFAPTSSLLHRDTASWKLDIVVYGRYHACFGLESETRSYFQSTVDIRKCVVSNADGSRTFEAAGFTEANKSICMRTSLLTTIAELLRGVHCSHDIINCFASLQHGR